MHLHFPVVECSSAIYHWLSPRRHARMLVASLPATMLQPFIVTREEFTQARQQAAREFQRALVPFVLVAGVADIGIVGGAVAKHRGLITPRALLPLEAPFILLLLGAVLWLIRGQQKRLKRYGLTCSQCAYPLMKRQPMDLATGACPQCGAGILTE